MLLLITNSKKGILPNQTLVHDSKCCKILFSLPLARGQSYRTNSSAWLHMLRNSFLLPISKEWILANFRWKTADLSNVFSRYHYQWRIITQPNSSTWIQTLQTSSLVPFRKGGRFAQPNSSAWLHIMLQTSFLVIISKGIVLPNQTLVHDSISCKRIELLSLARGAYYKTKFQCMTLNIAIVLSFFLLQEVSLTQPNSSAGLQMLQETFLVIISKERVLPN